MAELYLVTGPQGMQYVGVTRKTAQKRLSIHQKAAEDGIGPTRYFMNAIRKHGPKAFSVKTLVVGTWEYVLGLENAVIEKFDTMRPNGYNSREGGHAGVFGKEARANMSRGAKRRFQDPEQRAKVGLDTKRRMASPEAREAHSRRLKETMTPERLQKMSEISTETWKDPIRRKAQSNRAKAQWADPEKHERMLKQLAEARLKKKQGD